MTKEQQDLAWARLPKGARMEMRTNYPSDGSEWEDGYKAALKQYFGHHNLTSDTEPEEVLMVEKSKVQKLYSQLQKRYEEVKTKPTSKNIGQGHDYIVSERNFVNGAISELKLLFGDKCLPNKEEQNSPKLSSSFQIGKNEQSKPKYILQAELRLISSDGKTVEDYENIEVEMSGIDLTQAAEVVKKALQEFHEKNK